MPSMRANATQAGPVDFAAGGNFDLLESSGFSYPEKLGRWSLGDQSFVVVPVPVGARERELELSLTVWLPVQTDRAQKQTLVVLANDQKIHVGTVDGMTQVKARLAAALHCDAATIRLTFLHPRLKPNAAASQKTDSRPLAIFFQRLSLGPVEAKKPAPEPPRAELAPGTPIDESEYRAEDATELNAFCAGPHDMRLQMFGQVALAPPARLVAAETLPPAFAQDHAAFRTPRAGRVYAISDHTLWSNGFLRRGDEFFLPKDCFPEYFAFYIKEGRQEFPAVWAGALNREAPVRVEFDGPVASVLHPNLVYGHFLLEILPRLYQLSLLNEWGADIPVALSVHVPDWVKEFVGYYIRPERIFWYDHRTQYLAAPRFVVPSMLQADHHLHPAFNTMIGNLLSRIGTGAPAAHALPERLYLSRTKMPGPGRITNEHEVEQAMAGLGFTIMHPQTMSIAEQLRMYSHARVIVGEFSSALHNAMFMAPGSGVVAINFFNSYQSAIARMRRQVIAYVPPADGQFRHWRHTAHLSRQFAVNCRQLEDIARKVVDAVR